MPDPFSFEEAQAAPASPEAPTEGFSFEEAQAPAEPGFQWPYSRQGATAGEAFFGPILGAHVPRYEGLPGAFPHKRTLLEKAVDIPGAIYNAAAGLYEGAISPAMAATAATGGAGGAIPGVTRTASALWGTKMASDLPEQIVDAYGAYKLDEPLLEKIEKPLNVGLSTLFTGLAGRHALTRGVPLPESIRALQEKAAEPPAQPPVAEPVAEPVETETQWRVKGSGPVEVVDRNEAKKLALVRFGTGQTRTVPFSELYSVQVEKESGFRAQPRKETQGALPIEEAGAVVRNVPPEPAGVGEVPPAEGGAGVPPGDVSPGETAGRVGAGAETKPPVPLTPEEAASDAAERAAIDQGTADNKATGLPADVEIRDELPGGDPFARTIATIDKTGKILINRPEFRNWLERDLKGLSPERRRLAIQTLFSEEGIHAATRRVATDAELADLWNSLSGPERALVRKSYTGKFRGADISDSDMGHEYLRRTMQRLLRTGTRELAESKGFQRLSDRVIDIIERVIQAVRRLVGSRATTTLDALVNRLQEHIDAQKGENVPRRVPSEGGPKAIRRPSDEELIKNTGQGTPIPAISASSKQWLEEHAGEVLKDEAQEHGIHVKVIVKPSGLWAVASTPEKGTSGHHLGVVYSKHSTFKNGETTDIVDGNFKHQPELALTAARELLKFYEHGLPEAAEESFPASIRRVTNKELEEEIRDYPTPTIEKWLSSHKDILEVATTEKRKRELQSRIRIMEAELARRGEQSFPAARRRGKDKPEDPAQDPLNFLPPVPGHPGTEPTFASQTITPAGLDRVLTEHLAKDRPNFKGFRDELEQQFPGVQKGQLKEAWRDAVWKNLMGRPGAELSKLAERLGLRESVGRTIADAPTPEATVPFGLEAEPSGEIRGRVERVKRESREDASTATAVQHSRQNAIARIGEKLIGQAETEQRTFRRTSVTPDDIGWWREKEGIDPFREIKEADRKDPKALGDLLTRGGAEDRTGRKPPPETVTKRVTAFVDKTTGKVELVSTYRTARGNVYVRDPVSTAAKNNHVLLNTLLARNRYKAIYSALLDEPVKGFRQTFSSLADFKGEFVERAEDIAQTRRESAAEHPALQTEGRPPEPPGVLEKGHGAAMTDAEAGALLDHIKAEVGELTERSDLNDAVDALTARADENRLTPRDYQVINALQKAVRETEKANPKLKGTNEAIDQTLDRIYTQATQAHTRADFIARTLGQAPRPVRPVPPGKGTGSAPAAFRRQRDAFETFLQTAAASLKRSPTHGTIAYTLDAAESMARNIGQTAMRAIEVFSGSSGKRRPIFSQARKGQETAATALREEAIAIIQGGNDPARLRDFINRANNGINNARNAAATPGAGLFEKRRARRWEETATELKDIATRALANVGNARLQRLAQEGGNILRTQLRDERRSGINIRSIDDYVPGRYDPEFFNDNGVWFGEQRVLGRHYKSPKQFESYWHAIENGPYIPKKFDLADLVGHRVRQGRMEMGKNLWVEGGKTLIDPDSGEPVVRDLVPSRFAPSRMVAPTPEYELFSLGPGKATVSVRVGFKDLYDTLTLPSTIAKNPVGHAAMWATGLLKHGVMLILDTFHPGRLIQFGLGGMLNEVGYRKGYAALELREQDMARAVQTGMISQAEADWATGSVTVTRGGRPVTMTRQELLQEGQSKGLNVGRVTDAIYTHFFDSYPVIGRFNRWVFDRFTRGLMAQQFVTDVLRLNEKFPNKDFDVLARDVARDVNFTYGNIGRQGLIRNATIRDITQIALLAPQWFESLVQKELRFAYRLARAPDRFVRGEIPLGSLGRTMGRGLAGYFLLTQLINLATRGQLTFKNEEEGHKLDAWIPDVTGKTKGFFLSPLSVFAEVLHDVIRLTETKPTVVDAIRQIGENKLGPWGKMAMVFATGKSPEGNTLTSSGAVAKHMALQLAPAPISIGKFAREAAHAAAPTLIAPNRPGTVQRQLFGSGGVKIEAAASSTARIARKAQDFLKSKGLEKTGTVTEFTEDPSYVKLRQALRNSDGAAVKEIVGALKKTHTPQQLIKSLLAHTRFPFTGRALYEQAFIGSLSPADREVYRQARLEQVEELKKLPTLLHEASE